MVASEEEVRAPASVDSTLHTVEGRASQEEAMAPSEIIVATKVEIVKNREEETEATKVDNNEKGSENESTEPETNQENVATMNNAENAEKDLEDPENNKDEIKGLESDSQEKKAVEEDSDKQKEKKDECGEKDTEEEPSAPVELAGDLAISAGFLRRLLAERLAPEHRRGRRYRLAEAGLPAAVQVVRVEPAVGALTAFTVCDGMDTMDGGELGCFVTRGQVR